MKVSIILFPVFILVGLTTISNQFVVGQTPSLKFLTSSDYIDLADIFHVVEEIQNTSPNILRFVQIIGTFYDASGRVVATTNGYTSPSDLAPGTKAPYDLTVISASVPIAQIYNYSLTATYQR